MIILVLGGGRSGKSACAEKLAVTVGKKTVYIATAVPFDEEMKKRILHHQEQRPLNWATIEMYHEFQLTPENEGLFSDSGCVLLDSLGMMVNNIMFDCKVGLENPQNDQEPAHKGLLASKSFSPESLAEKAALRSAETLIKTCREQEKDLILVAEEVGMGIVPETYLTRCYRDILGTVNKRAAALADQVYFVVAGIERKIK